MKKIIALAVFVVLAAACTTQPPATNAPASNTNTAATAKASPPVAEAEATAREKATWEAIKNKDYDGFASLLASDYLEVGGDGVFDKAGIVKNVKELTLADATFSDWKVLPIDKDTVMLTYQVTLKGTVKNQEIPPGPYRAAAAWQNRDGKWLAVYYQEALARTATPGATPTPATPAASPAARTSPTAATSPAVPGPDAVANEKLVWDAIKNKNYDQFAAMLAADSIEVEPDGVYDKSASVKGVSSADLSKAQLSDWKTVKFDSDATLVTYVLTMPGAKPPKEYHSTVWINRDGKWQALYHQGTPVGGPPPSPPPAKATATK